MPAELPPDDPHLACSIATQQSTFRIRNVREKIAAFRTLAVHGHTDTHRARCVLRSGEGQLAVVDDICGNILSIDGYRCGSGRESRTRNGHDGASEGKDR